MTNRDDIEKLFKAHYQQMYRLTINLIIALNLPRISVSTLNNTINIDGQDVVQLRINGVEVSTEEVLALNPQNISRVEYIDNPGMR